MPLFTDQTDHLVELPGPPQRIVSLVPSQTELLYDLGLGDRIAGITKFCVHPRLAIQGKTIVGGTKTVKMDVIRQLRPDCIMANKEENVREQVEALRRHYPVWTSHINHLDDAYGMIAAIGGLTGAASAARQLIDAIRFGFDRLQPAHPPRRAAYLIWQKPFMTIGGDTFINDMLQRCGLVNVFAGRTRYPEIGVEDMLAAQCELLLLSSEPFPFKDRHVQEWEQRLPGVKVLLADGEMFSWYGSRLLLAPEYFGALLKNVR